MASTDQSIDDGAILKAVCCHSSFPCSRRHLRSHAGAWERGNAGAWERGTAGAWERGNAGAWERGNAGAWERGISLRFMLAVSRH